MKLTLIAVLLLLVKWSDAQYSIQGRIVDGETQQPLEGISVFLSNTTKGSATNHKGEFVLDNLKVGKYELVITAVNFEEHILPIQVTEKNETLTVKLTRKATVLNEVTVEPYDKDGWDKWGDSFKTYLVGSSHLAKNCILKNPDAIKFQYNSKLNRLRAFSNERLLFDNTDLGYRVIYLLSKFEIDFNDATFSFRGYPVFEELRPKSKTEMARWAKLRSDIYRGSLHHFIRSLYFNRSSSDGFTIREVKFITPEESRRVKNILKSMHRSEDQAGVGGWANEKDSMDYYVKVKNLSFNDNMVVVRDNISGDNLLTRSTDPNSKSLFFKGELQILYLNKKIPIEYANTLPVNRRNEAIQSEISLRIDTPVAIYPNGTYYNGLNLLIDGYWAWSERIATMLPGDYVDGK